MKKLNWKDIARTVCYTMIVIACEFGVYWFEKTFNVNGCCDKEMIMFRIEMAILWIVCGGVIMTTKFINKED